MHMAMLPYNHYIRIFLLIQKGRSTCLGKDNQIVNGLTQQVNTQYALEDMNTLINHLPYI